MGGYPIQDMPAGRRIRGIIRCAIGLKSLSSGCAKRCGPQVAPWSDRETVTSYGLTRKTRCGIQFRRQCARASHSATAATGPEFLPNPTLVSVSESI
jgi:hypothetical protein